MQTTGRPNPSPSGAARRLGAGLRLNAAMSIVAAAGLFGIVALTQVAPKSSSPPVTATPSLYDGDGVPHTITGEPVLRGAAIITRAAAGGGTPFLVAGWHTTDPQPTCVPNAIRCGYTSLVDAPGSHSSGLVTLDRPAGQQFSFNVAEAWAGGFYVLRVRAGCAMGAGTCLVVEEIIGPQAALPIDATGFDADGLPRTVDGQPVARGSDIASRLQLGRDTQPVYVAGLPEAATPTGASPCTDPVTWDQHPCPAVHLADPARGLPFGQAAPLLQVDPWIGESAWQPTATWPGGYVVIRAWGVGDPGRCPAPGVPRRRDRRADAVAGLQRNGLQRTGDRDRGSNRALGNGDCQLSGHITSHDVPGHRRRAAKGVRNVQRWLLDHLGGPSGQGRQGQRP